VRCLTLISLILLSTAWTQAQTYDFDTLELAFEGARFVTPTAINNRGDLAGSYVDHYGQSHGFRRINGVDHLHPYLSIRHLNDFGQMVGTAFFPNQTVTWGFLADDTDYMPLVMPERVAGRVKPSNFTQGLGINHRGIIVGNYRSVDNSWHGFASNG
jgi:hypothetical protein